MSVFVDILNLLSGPTGGMAYHLILLFCIWAIVGLALSGLSRGGQSRAAENKPEREPRILLAGALISLGRFLPIVIALLDRQDGVSLVRLGPPLERFVDTLSALLICSAFVLPVQKKTLNRVLLAIFGLLTLALYAIAAFQWTNILNTLPSALYNRAVQRWAWELWQLAFLVPALVYVMFGPIKEREALSASLGVLVVAHLAQALYPVSSQIPHAAGWVRLANLISFPLLGVSTYMLIFQRFETEAVELQSVNEQSLGQITNLISLLEASTQLSRSLDLNQVLKNAVRTIAQELQSDLCALALLPTAPALTAPAEASELELAVVFDTPEVFYEGTRFGLSNYPAIQHAVMHNRPAILGAQGPAGYDVSTSPGESAAIFRLLKSEQTGPLIIQPIESSARDKQGPVIGAMLVCRTDPRLTFTSDQVQKSESLAVYLGPAIENARRYHDAETRIEELAKRQHSSETEHVRARTDLENRLQTIEGQTAAYMQRMYEAERGEQQAQKDAHQVRREMARLQQEAEQKIAQARTDLRHGIQHTARLTQRIAELDSERIRLTQLVETLQLEQETQKLRLEMTAVDQPHQPTDALPAQGKSAEPSADSTAGGTRVDSVPADTWSAKDLSPDALSALLDDLSQPTATLLHDTELLANGALGPLDSRQRALLGRVRANTERLSSMLGNLATRRDIERGTLAPSPVPTHISNLIKSALDNVRFRLEEKHLRTRLALGAVPVVLVDPGIVQRILDNLLDKLCHHAQEGTTIGIQAFMEQQETRWSTAPARLNITLHGTGSLECPGQEGTSELPSDRGLVHMLTQAHGGQVECVRQPDTGITFRLTLPVQVASARPADTLRAGQSRE